MIYLIRNEGQEGPYPKEVVRGMYDRGQMPSGTLYWQQGMADWAPIAELFGAPPPPPAATPPPLPEEAPNGQPWQPNYAQLEPAPTRARRKWFKDVPSIGKATVIMLSILLGLDILDTLLQIFGWARLTNSPSLATAHAQSGVELSLGLIYLLLFLVTAVCFLTWVYRAHSNVREWGARDMSGSPSMSVVWFFIPLANLYFPYKHTRELCQASRNPRDWRNQTAHLNRVGLWWAAWIGAGVIGQITTQYALGMDETVENYLRLYQLGVAAQAISAFSAFFAIRVVSTITRLQQEWVDGATAENTVE
ncbi:MAG: hypothetical protein E1N59_3321 [Puniceicoccaceae bacterium 5H]|nr:MAG: hypothetical protein E1N59_3321 [Puniceicoccaceae bacterium 5H]